MLCKQVGHTVVTGSNRKYAKITIPCFIVLAAVFVPLHEDRFYDLSGALGWLSTSFLSLYYPALKARFVEGTISSLPHITSFAPRQLLLSAAVGIWSARLGTFLGIVGCIQVVFPPRLIAN